MLSVCHCMSLETFSLTCTANVKPLTTNVKPLTKFLILQLYYNSFYTSFEVYQTIIKLVLFSYY
jgi:hypothetical protein